jgi:hypothetical protein
LPPALAASFLLNFPLPCRSQHMSANSHA